MVNTINKYKNAKNNREGDSVSVKVGRPGLCVSDPSEAATPKTL